MSAHNEQILLYNWVTHLGQKSLCEPLHSVVFDILHNAPASLEFEL